MILKNQPEVEQNVGQNHIPEEGANVATLSHLAEIPALHFVESFKESADWIVYRGIALQ